MQLLLNGRQVGPCLLLLLLVQEALLQQADLLSLDESRGAATSGRIRAIALLSLRHPRPQRLLEVLGHRLAPAPQALGERPVLLRLLLRLRRALPDDRLLQRLAPLPNAGTHRLQLLLSLARELRHLGQGLLGLLLRSLEELLGPALGRRQGGQGVAPEGRQGLLRLPGDLISTDAPHGLHHIVHLAGRPRRAVHPAGNAPQAQLAQQRVAEGEAVVMNQIVVTSLPIRGHASQKPLHLLRLLLRGAHVDSSAVPVLGMKPRSDRADSGAPWHSRTVAPLPPIDLHSRVKHSSS
mmetsp:Transcript_136094/g.322594  ORF Transcript_136094/g.322594 Transcript_136094/m.322594 type:complete len:294 (-) Transcript_136094:359-1240(-)